MSRQHDLYEMVQNFTAATAANAATENMQEEENPFSKFSSISNPNYDNSFSFPDFNEKRNYIGLEEIYNDIDFFKPKEITTSIENLQQPNNTPPPLQEFNNSLADSSVTLQPIDSPNKVIKRRKNETVKLVHQMTQEQLSADSWTWRKYGQKPIKGTPHPRHYYRCSFSRGCSAKKQVEQSVHDSTIFLVHYSGEHTHARPVCRISNCGVPRRRNPCIAGGSVPRNQYFAAPSPASAATLSPATLPPATHPMGDGIEDDEVIMIPNALMAEEIIRGFEEINRGNRGRCSVNLDRSDSDSKVGKFSGGKFSGGSTSGSAAFGGVF